MRNHIGIIIISIEFIQEFRETAIETINIIIISEASREKTSLFIIRKEV